MSVLKIRAICRRIPQHNSSSPPEHNVLAASASAEHIFGSSEERRARFRSPNSNPGLGSSVATEERAPAAIPFARRELSANSASDAEMFPPCLSGGPAPRPVPRHSPIPPTRRCSPGTSQRATAGREQSSPLRHPVPARLSHTLSHPARLHLADSRFHK